MMKISVPKLLQKGEAIKINTKISENIGAFPFISPDVTFLMSEPASYAQAFISYVIALYNLYHDFGCKLLVLFLSNESKHHRSRVFEIRSMISHGHILAEYKSDDNSKETITEKNVLLQSLKYYFVEFIDLKNYIWPEFIYNITDEMWQKATEKLVYEADKIYDELNQYAIGNKSIEPYIFQENIRKSLDIRLYKQCYINLDCEHQKFTNIEIKFLLKTILFDKDEKSLRTFEKWLKSCVNKDSEQTWQEYLSFLICQQKENLSNPDNFLNCVKKTMFDNIKKLADDQTNNSGNSYYKDHKPPFINIETYM